jgi:hypothetical protein
MLLYGAAFIKTKPTQAIIATARAALGNCTKTSLLSLSRNILEYNDFLGFVIDMALNLIIDFNVTY